MEGPHKKSCCFHLFLLDCNDFSSPSAFGGVCERGGTYNDFFGQEVVDWRRYFLNCGRENFETTHGEIFSFLRERERGGQNFPRKTCTLFFIRFALFGALLFFIAIWDFHFTAWHFKAFPLSSPVRFDVGSEFFFFFLIFRKLCRGVAAPAASQHRNNQTIASRWKTVGGNRRKISALNQMQIERSPSGFSLLEIFNFPLASLPAPVCLLPEKQTGIDFLSPRVFPHLHH